MDRDPHALELAAQRLSIFPDRYYLVRASYRTLREQLARLGWDSVQGILMDLGVSSMQIDTPSRGFSFQSEGPLDMRFDPSQPTTAADLVNQLPEDELARILWEYGEEPHSRRIARGIVQSRPIHTTRQLAEVVQKHSRGERGRIHPATRTFQALRIAVNDELGELARALHAAERLLAPGGRLVVVTFHSLEDRIVKQFFASRQGRGGGGSRHAPLAEAPRPATFADVIRPVTPSQAELAVNPRARSAKLRAATRTDAPPREEDREVASLAMLPERPGRRGR